MYIQLYCFKAEQQLWYSSNAMSHSPDTSYHFYWSTRVINICNSSKNCESSKQYSIKFLLSVLIAQQIATSHGLLCYNGGHIAILYLATVISLVQLFTSLHCQSTFSQSSVYETLMCSTFNLTHTVSYGTYGTLVVIYMPVFTKNEDTELSLGLLVNLVI